MLITSIVRGWVRRCVGVLQGERDGAADFADAFRQFLATVLQLQPVQEALSLEACFRLQTFCNYDRLLGTVKTLSAAAPPPEAGSFPAAQGGAVRSQQQGGVQAAASAGRNAGDIVGQLAQCRAVVEQTEKTFNWGPVRQVRMQSVYYNLHYCQLTGCMLQWPVCMYAS